MRLTTKGRFAVTAMIDLGMRHGQGPVTLAGISDRQKISLSYLEQLFGKLRRHALVDSVRGPGGGYCLAKSMDEVSVADIIRAVDEPIDATQCGGRGNCRDDEQQCMTHDLWMNLNARIFDYLTSVKLSHLVESQNVEGVAVANDGRGGHIGKAEGLLVA
ncbi:Fe-S cluster assembly transcription factor [Sulfurirhabdus autotrophica]|uniref:BadM/Rrf2 family transcriptional regulator n=1 Tax=Sulfurirhabdus autotrophica TaxID=1706046 RepID=A0A4R3YFN9_9PROT|nr:Fe-S cluster assembly transcription factor [Sulfurirhabdus autotrophica]TCV90752.1 BadM/Rrf2 family transcriptional regulator [Sulfurirhabdus autotrophica]